MLSPSRHNKVSVLKTLGDDNDPADWETWTSPVITIDRP
jgi:hypothetical protein